MTDPVQEAIAELIFADQLVDIHELEAIEADAWFRSYLSLRQLDAAAFTSRLMTAHEDPAVDEQALDQLPMVDREALLCLLADITAIDDHHDPREVAVLSRLASSLRLHQPDVEQRLLAARQRIAPLRMQLNRPMPRLRKRVRALRRVDRLIGQARMDGWADQLGQKVRLRRWRRETFFNDKAYADSLQEMHRLTLELMPLTQELLQQATTSLLELQGQFQCITKGLVSGDLPKESQQQLASLLSSGQERLDRIVQDDLDELRSDLLAKQRSLNRFCMAVVGRTKAGKSTVIATLTGRDPSAKGDGGQGFTRYNRAYNYCGIRLIDTPGIGAAGGQGESSQQAEQRDSSLARSIFPETDLVCFVMDIDPNAPCMREMIDALHQRGKAFIILLNVKAGTQGGIDLCRQRLDAKFAREGEQSISGNIAAIRRDLSSVLGVQAAEAVPIISIHAISAFKATYSIHDPYEKEAWRELSRMDLFLEQLDQLVTDQAPQLRRRTLRDNPRRELERIACDLGVLGESLQAQAKIFADTEQSAMKQTMEIFTDLKHTLRGRIDELFQKLEVEATSFSADHFRKSGSEIERRWRRTVEKFALNEKLDDELTWLKTELTARLEELQADILARLQFQVGTVNLKQHLDFSHDIGFEENLRRNVNLGFKVVSGALGVALVALGLVSWPASLVVAAISFIPAILDWFLPNAEARRQEAKSTLKRKLLETLVEPRAQIATQFEAVLRQLLDQVSTALHQSLGGSRLALLAFQEELLKTQADLQQQAQRLNRTFSTNPSSTAASMTSFQLAELQSKIESSLDQLQNILLSRGEPALQTTASALQQQRHGYRDRPLLSLAFSGQFSAGKSTIISALTGETDIRISADVATDEVKAYRWRNIELWDSPGLYADRTGHTAKAEQAQREADLIVYCLTTNLFDNVIAADFRRLAFEKGYAPKLFLLINKLSMEDVENTDAYIKTLTTSIDRILAPHRLSEFNHAFIDAQDYRDGLATSSQDLIRFSRFAVFVDLLNDWIKQRGLLARLDPPVRLGLSAIDEALGTLPEKTFEQNPELFLLNQQLRIVQTQQRRTEAEVSRLGSRVVQKLQLLGEQLLSGELGEAPKLAEAGFQTRCEQINQTAFDELNSLIQESYQQLQTKLDDFANEPLVVDYFANVDASQAGSVSTGDQAGAEKANPIKGVAKMLLEKGLDRFGLPAGLLTGTKQVAGTAGHQLVYNVGKMFGKNFRPWEAVKMAKGIGQAIGILGIAMSAYEIYEQVNEGAKAEENQRRYDQQLQEARAQIRTLADAMATQFREVYQKEYELPVIGVILERLNAERDRVLTQEASNKELVQQLSAQRSELNGYLQQLYDVDQ